MGKNEFLLKILVTTNWKNEIDSNLAIDFMYACNGLTID